MVSIHGAVQAVGLALVVLFFVMGVMKTCGSFADLKRPEVAIKVFVRFAIAKAAVTYGLELMNALSSIAQGLVSTIMSAAGFGSVQTAVLPTEIITSVEDCGFFESIPLWAVTLIGVAEIMYAVQYLVEHPEFKHGPIRIGLTPDEEIGRGVAKFDVKKFDATYAYTMDGGEVGELEFENFNAAAASVHIQGRNVHPGYAKGKMKNATAEKVLEET